MLRKTFLKTISLSLAATLAMAAPTLELRSGQTTVALAQEFLNAATTLGVRVAPLAEGQIRVRNNRTSAVFPVTNGSVDTGSLRLEVFHSGGLSLTAGDTVVTLEQFAIENTVDGNLRLKGIVTANGTMVGEVPIFDLTLTESPSARPGNLLRSDILLGGNLRLAGVRVTLSGEAASALNSVFNVTAFSRGLNIGTATVEAFFDERQNLL